MILLLNEKDYEMVGNTEVDESLQLPNPRVWPLPGPDPKDTPFLSLAKESGAWLVTGNLKHFPETLRDGVNALSPGDYLSRLTASR